MKVVNHSMAHLTVSVVRSRHAPSSKRCVPANGHMHSCLATNYVHVPLPCPSIYPSLCFCFCPCRWLKLQCVEPTCALWPCVQITHHDPAIANLTVHPPAKNRERRDRRTQSASPTPLLACSSETATMPHGLSLYYVTSAVTHTVPSHTT